MDRTYEMLWDCRFCGTKKLLGKTHRHCPGCGAPQDPSARYYPSDEEKVAVEDHLFHGADRVCASCETPSSAAAHHCGNCGASLAAAAAVATRKDQVGTSFAGETVKDAGREREAGARGAPVAAPARSRRGRIIAMVAGVLLVLAGVVVLLTWSRQSQLRVSGHSWNRRIAVELFAPKSDSSWCDAMPRDAYRISRSREVRSHRKVADGQECRTRRRDNGDGTFTEVRECETKYREEPVHDERCHYTVDRWQHARFVEASGKALEPAPAWPKVELTRAGTCLGCEREGRRSESYRVHMLEDGSGKTHDCDLDEQRWSGLAPRTACTGEVGVVTGMLDCDSLKVSAAASR